MRDVPVNEEFELEVGMASDVEVQGAVVSNVSHGERDRVSLAYTLTNAKPVPVTVRAAPAAAAARLQCGGRVRSARR